MKPLLSTITLLTCFALCGYVSVVHAQSQTQNTQQLSRAFMNGNNVPSTGLALEGYCPVCYLAANKAAKGNPNFSYDHDGVTYWFVSAEVRDTFIADPDKYVPAYGGWCAVGMATGQRFPVDPTNFKIVDGRIMLFLKNASVDAVDIWNKNQPDNLKKADANWKKANPSKT
jgi:YHS domain-containing protein